MIILLSLGFFVMASGQKYITKNGYIGFFSHTPLEDIKADNNQVASVLDTSTGEIVFQVLLKSFHFQKTLMQEHFNENYVESDKFPKSTFSGRITNLSAVNFSKNGVYDVTVEGDLMIHGVTRKVMAKGSIEILTGEIKADSKFIIVPEDYNIKIPAVVRNNIAKTIEITVTMKYSPLGNQ
jgi:polyisoprenoid-binding protein YceI